MRLLKHVLRRLALGSLFTTVAFVTLAWRTVDPGGRPKS
jgi:hypothetical protein